MNASELRALPVNELEAKLIELKEEFMRLRCLKSIGRCSYD